MTASTLTVLHPGDPGFDDAAGGFQTHHPHRPELIALPRSAEEVRAALELAGDRPVAVQSTGHGRARALDGGVLLSTARLTGVHVDPAARTARAGAGATWADVVEAAAPHGLAPVNGSSPGVGVVGYLLGGGYGILGRAFGPAADRVTAVEGVTRDGVAVQLPTLDGIGDTVVTAVEFGLVPLPQVWGGTLSFPVSDDLLSAFADAAADLPAEVSASLALVPVPDIPAVPEHLRGAHLAQVRVVGTREVPLDALRGIGPVREESVRRMPYADSHTIHADPTDPHAYAGDAHLLRAADPAALHTVAAATGPASPAPSVVELRVLGGAFGGPGQFLLRAVTMLGPVTEPGARAAHGRLFAPFAPDDLGRVSTFAYGLAQVTDE